MTIDNTILVNRFWSSKDDSTRPFTSFQEASMDLRIHQHSLYEAVYNLNCCGECKESTLSLEMAHWCKLPSGTHDACNCSFQEACISAQDDSSSDNGEYIAHFSSISCSEGRTVEVKEYVDDVIWHIFYLCRDVDGGRDDILHLNMAPWVAELFVLQCCVFPFCNEGNFVSICDVEDPYFGIGQIPEVCFNLCHEYGRSFGHMNTRIMTVWGANVDIHDEGYVIDITFSEFECHELSTSSQKCRCQNCETFLLRNMDKTGFSCQSDMEDLEDLD